MGVNMKNRKNLFATEGVTQSDRSLHTPGNFAKQNLLYVQEAGILKSLSPHRCIREKLDSFLFLVVLEGSGSLEAGGRVYEIKQGDCAFIDCMEHYEHISSEEDAWELAWVHFNGQAARSYFELFYNYNKECNLIYESDTETWKGIISKLLEKIRSKNIIAELGCGELLLHMLNMIIDSVVNQDEVDQRAESIWCNEMREFLNEEYAEAEILNILSKKYDMPLEEISNKFRKYYDIGVEEYVINRRFNAAKELLRFTIKPMEEVILESGLGDVVTMQKMFRENEDMSAEEYRMRWAQWIK